MAIYTDLIYNIVQYLRDNLAGETIYPEERFPISGRVPERNILIRDTGGTEVEVLENNTYQITVRDTNSPAAKKLSDQVYELLQGDAKTNGRFGLILPSTVVNGVNISSIQTARITAIQRPESLGKNPDGLSEFSINFQIFI